LNLPTSIIADSLLSLDYTAPFSRLEIEYLGVPHPVTGSGEPLFSPEMWFFRGGDLGGLSLHASITSETHFLFSRYWKRLQWRGFSRHDIVLLEHIVS